MPRVTDKHRPAPGTEQAHFTVLTTFSQSSTRSEKPTKKQPNALGFLESSTVFGETIEAHTPGLMKDVEISNWTQALTLRAPRRASGQTCPSTPLRVTRPTNPSLERDLTVKDKNVSYKFAIFFLSKAKLRLFFLKTGKFAII